MMLTTAFALALISVFFEMILVTKQPAIRHFFTRHEVMGMVFSFGLSIFLGSVFGAQGLIALMGGVGSTVITTIIYKTHALKLMDEYKVRKIQIDAQVKQVVTTTLKTVVLIWKIFTAPVRLIMWVRHQYDLAVSSVHRVTSKVHTPRPALTLVENAKEGAAA